VKIEAVSGKSLVINRVAPRARQTSWSTGFSCWLVQLVSVLAWPLDTNCAALLQFQSLAAATTTTTTPITPAAHDAALSSLHLPGIDVVSAPL